MLFRFLCGVNLNFSKQSRYFPINTDDVCPCIVLELAVNCRRNTHFSNVISALETLPAQKQLCFVPLIDN